MKEIKPPIRNQILAENYIHQLLARKRKMMIVINRYNHNRHTLFRILGEEKLYWLMWKEEPYNTFGIKFTKQYEPGESINIEWLEKAILRDADLVFIHKKGCIHKMSAKEFLRIAEEGKFITNKQRRINFVRRDDCSGRDRPIREGTYSAPLREMERWDKTLLDEEE